MKHALLLTLILSLGACNHVLDNTPPDNQTLKESRPVGATKSLDVRLRYDVGALEVGSDKGENLFSLNLDYDASRSTPRFHFKEGDRAELELVMEQRMGFNSRRGNDLTLKLNESVPIHLLDFTSGVSESHMDLTGL